MSSIKKVLITAILFVSLNLPAQTASFGGSVGIAQPIQTSSSDSIVAVTADAYGLSLVAPSDLPRGGTYWEVLPYGGMVPLPCPPLDQTLPIYAITDNIFLVDATGGQIAASPRSTATMSRSAQSLSVAVDAQGNAIANLIEQVQDAQMMRDMAAMFGMDMPMFDSGNEYSANFAYSFDTNQLWIEITNVANGVSYLNLHNATNQVYAIWTTTDLLQPFTVEMELWPTDGNCQPFTLANYDRQILFVRAQDWTGVTHGGNTTPDWWLWMYFGTTALSDTNLDSQGNTLGYDYAHGLDPNVIQFTIEAASQYVNNPTVSPQLNVTAGSPDYYAVLVNGQTTTNWQPFTTTNLSVYLGATDGVYNVSIGLRGLPANAQQTWDSYSFTLDRVAPKISLTNPAGGMVVKPYLQLQGYANKPLASLSYDISNGAGSVTNQDAFVTDQSFDTNKFDFTTNYFQAYDVPLATNANYITLRVTDRAGNTTTTNFNVVLDYSSATNPPTVNVLWPQDGMAIGGSSFTLRGTMSDETGNVTAQIVDEAGNTNTVAGLVERNGIFWVENLPLTTNGDNTITITATDAAGNVTTTNLTVTASDVTLTIDHTPTGDALYQGYGSVSGTISDSSYSVSVNGVTVTNDYWTDGVTWYWEADNVPIYGQGTATFDAVANPPEQSSFSQSRFQTQASTPTPPTANTTLTVVKDAQVVITTYHVTKSISSTNSSATNAFSYARVKDYVANYATNSAGQWYLQDYQGTVTDNYQSWYGTNWDWTQDWVLWSDLGDETSQTNSSGSSYYAPFIPSSWDAYGHFTGLPDEDLWAFGQEGEVPPRWIYHYWANNVQQHLVSGNWAADISVDARTTMKLFTGGKAAIQRRNLIQLQCGAEAYGKPLPGNQWGPVFAEWAGVPKTPIAAARLRALGQWVGSDGNLWLALPDNEALTLNLAAPASHYNAWATPTKYPVTITANGNDLSVTNPEFCVGQKVTFSLNNLPTGNIVNMIGNWQLPAKFVNEAWQNQIFVPTPPVGGYYISSGSVNYRTNSSLLENTNQTSCWFYNINSGHVSVGLNLLFNNGQTASVAANGDFTVFRPTISNFVPQSPIVVDLDTNGLPSIYLGCGDKSGSSGMGWDLTVHWKTNFNGKFFYTQLIDREQSWDIHWDLDFLTRIPRSSSTGGFWADNGEVYEPPYASLIDTTERIYKTHSQAPMFFGDRPYLEDNLYSYADLADSFSTYLRFQPAGGIPVTIGRVAWGWHGQTAVSDGIWSLGLDTVTGPSLDDAIDAFPEWTDVYLNSQN